ncbi:MAG TPA: hypothetical protein VKU62_13035 [Thermoanaerobaculia bacterium]|nr:hypothetical protein [Thermoanaerobaculia bacterium]
MTSNNRARALAVVAALLAVPAAHATVAAAASFDQKVDKAASIIVGKCLHQESRFDPTGRWILTYSTFQVEKTLKGNPEPEVTIVTPGGQVGDLHQSTIGIPAFKPGDENVIFVKNSSAGQTVLYFDQGAYEVKNDSSGPVVAPVASDLVKVDTQRGVVVPSEKPLRMQDFEQRVNDTVRSLREEHNRMDVLAAEKLRQQASLWSLIKENKWTILLALAGLAYATLLLVRRVF